MELLITSLAVFAVAALTGLGVVVLPWTETELDGAQGALGAVPAVARAGARRVGAGLPAPVPVGVARAR